MLAAASASAAPKSRDAKVAFDRGVAAYQKGDFAAASAALGTAFKLEADVETLFAWAQSERQLEHCDKAVELFGKLLEFDMPAENKQAVQSKIDECKAILATQKPVQKPTQKPVPPEPVVDEPAPPEPSPVRPPPEVVDAPPAGPEGRSPWWKDPIGDSLVIAGVAGLAVGGYFLVSGRQAERDSQANYFDFPELDARAEQHGKIGVISTVVGGALIAGGIVRYVTRSGGKAEPAAVSGWLAPSGGGLAALGRF